jgi:hypothetical protein
MTNLSSLDDNIIIYIFLFLSNFLQENSGGFIDFLILFCMLQIVVVLLLLIKIFMKKGWGLLS